MQTGDILIGRRFSGDAAEWMLLSGGFANHAAMIIEDPENPRAKYVIDCPSDLGFAEGTSGVRQMEFTEWIDQALEQDYEIVWLPLSKNLRTFGDLD